MAGAVVFAGTVGTGSTSRGVVAGRRRGRDRSGGRRRRWSSRPGRGGRGPAAPAAPVPFPMPRRRGGLPADGGRVRRDNRLDPVLRLADGRALDRPARRRSGIGSATGRSSRAGGAATTAGAAVSQQGDEATAELATYRVGRDVIRRAQGDRRFVEVARLDEPSTAEEAATVRVGGLVDGRRVVARRHVGPRRDVVPRRQVRSSSASGRTPRRTRSGRSRTSRRTTKARSTTGAGATTEVGTTSTVSIIMISARAVAAEAIRPRARANVLRGICWRFRMAVSS